MAFFLAVMASLVNALSSVFQRIGVQNAPDESSLRLELVRHAVKQLVWLVGFVLIIVGFVLQAVALRFGNLSSVQPIATTELVFLVLILAVWFRTRLTWREWCGALAAAGGLAAFLAVAAPGGGRTIPGAAAWTTAFIVIGGGVAATTVLGLTGPRWFRATMLGIAAGLLFALAAAFTKQFTTLVTEGWSHVFTSWSPYALAGCGLAGLFYAQSALHAGPITASQAMITIVDPLASVLLGIWLFHDHLVIGTWQLPVELVAAAAVVFGVALLAGSRLVAGTEEDTAESDRLERRHPPGPVTEGDVALSPEG
ncbi:MAG: DMT family transporter [Acidimicrobiales bacterium]